MESVESLSLFVNFCVVVIAIAGIVLAIMCNDVHSRLLKIEARISKGGKKK